MSSRFAMPAVRGSAKPVSPGLRWVLAAGILLLSAVARAETTTFNVTLRVESASGMASLFIGADAIGRVVVEDADGTNGTHGLLSGTLRELRMGERPINLPSTTDYTFSNLPIEVSGTPTLYAGSTTQSWGAVFFSATDNAIPWDWGDSSLTLTGRVWGTVLGMEFMAIVNGREVTGEVSAVSNIQPPAVTNGPAVTRIHATTFLRSNSGWTTHTLMSPKISEAERERRIEMTATDYPGGVIYIYAANEGDYGGQSVMYRPEDKAAWRDTFLRCRRAGLGVIVWMRADDSSGLNRWTYAQWEELYRNFCRDLDDLVDEYVIGLEVNEYWLKLRALQVDLLGTEFHSVDDQCLIRLEELSTGRLIDTLRKYTGKKIGVHTGGMGSIAYADKADAFYLQTGFNKSPNEIANLVRQAVGRWNGQKPVIAAEYNKSGESNEARAQGEAAVRAGAAGVGTGVSVEGFRILQERARGVGGPPQAPPPTPPGPIASNDMPDVVAWPSGQDVSRWPVTVQMRVTRNGGGAFAWSETGDRSTWPSRDAGATVNANIWRLQRVRSNAFKASTWEYLRPGQTSKSLSNLNVSEIPKGDGVFIAGITRDPSKRNTEKRSNVEWIK